MNFLYDKNTLKIFALYSGTVSQLTLMQSELPDMNLGEFYYPDALEVLSNPNRYLLVFTDGVNMLQGPYSSVKTSLPAEELSPVGWRRKPGVNLELSADSVVAGQEAALTVTVTDGFDPVMCPEVELLFNGVPQMFTLDGSGQAVITLAPTEAMALEIKPESSFFRGDSVRLEVLPA